MGITTGVLDALVCPAAAGSAVSIGFVLPIPQVGLRCSLCTANLRTLQPLVHHTLGTHPSPAAHPADCGRAWHTAYHRREQQHGHAPAGGRVSQRACRGAWGRVWKRRAAGVLCDDATGDTTARASPLRPSTDDGYALMTPFTAAVGAGNRDVGRVRGVHSEARRTCTPPLTHTRVTHKVHAGAARGGGIASDGGACAVTMVPRTLVKLPSVAFSPK